MLTNIVSPSILFAPMRPDEKEKKMAKRENTPPFRNSSVILLPYSSGMTTRLLNREAKASDKTRGIASPFVSRQAILVLEGHATMLLNRISQTFSLRHFAIFAAGAALIGLTLGTAPNTVQARSGIVPIEIEPDSVLTPGKFATVRVSVSAAPAAVRVYSQPSGVLFYQGTVTSTTTDLKLNVNPLGPKGPVTVSVSVEGNSISAQATLAP